MKLAPAVLCVLVLAAGGCSREPQGSGGTTNPPGTVVENYQEALTRARSENKPILLVVYEGSPADVEQMVLSEPAITQRTSRFVTAKVDLNKESAALTPLGITQAPTVAILRSDGSLLWQKSGAAPPEIVAAMDQAVGGAAPAGQ